MDNEKFDPITNNLDSADPIEDNSLGNVIDDNNMGSVLDNSHMGDAIDGGGMENAVPTRNQKELDDAANGVNNTDTENAVPTSNGSGAAGGIAVDGTEAGKSITTDTVANGTEAAGTEAVEGAVNGTANGAANAVGGLKGAIGGVGQITNKMIGKVATKMGIPAKVVSVVLAASVGLSSMVMINSPSSNDGMQTTRSEQVVEDAVVTHVNEQMQYFGELNGKQKLEAAHKIYNYFKAIGYTDEAIAGILSNIEAESALRGDYYSGKEISMFDSIGEIKRFAEGSTEGRDIMFEYYDKDWHKYMTGLYLQYANYGTQYNGEYSETAKELEDEAKIKMNVPDGDTRDTSMIYTSCGFNSYNRARYDAALGTNLSNSVFAVKENGHTVNAIPGFGLFQFAGDRANDFLYFANCQKICSDYNFDQINDEWVSIPMQIAYLYFENKECEPGMTINEWGTRDWYQGREDAVDEYSHDGEDTYDESNDQFGKFCLVDRNDTFLTHYNEADDPSTPEKNEREWYWDPENWCICHVVISRTSMNDVVVEYLTIKIDEDEEQRWLDALDDCKTGGFDRIKNHKIMETLYTMNYSVMVYTIVIPSSELSEESRSLDGEKDTMKTYQKDPRIKVDAANVELDSEGNPKDLYHLFHKLSTNEAVEWMKTHYPDSFTEYDDFNKEDPNTKKKEEATTEATTEAGGGALDAVSDVADAMKEGMEEAVDTVSDLPSHGAFRTVSRWEWDCNDPALGDADSTVDVELPKDADGNYYDDKLKELVKAYKDSINTLEEYIKGNGELKKQVSAYRRACAISDAIQPLRDAVNNCHDNAGDAYTSGDVWAILRASEDVMNKDVDGDSGHDGTYDVDYSYTDTTTGQKFVMPYLRFDTCYYEWDDYYKEYDKYENSPEGAGDDPGKDVQRIYCIFYVDSFSSDLCRLAEAMRDGEDLYGYKNDVMYEINWAIPIPDADNYISEENKKYTDDNVSKMYDAVIDARDALVNYYNEYKAADGPRDQLVKDRAPYQADKRDIDYLASFVDSGADGESEYITPEDRLYKTLHTYSSYPTLSHVGLSVKHLLGTDLANQSDSVNWPDQTRSDHGDGFYEDHPIENRDDYRGVTGSLITDAPYVRAGGDALQRGFDTYHYIDQYTDDSGNLVDDAFEKESIEPMSIYVPPNINTWKTKLNKTEGVKDGLTKIEYYTNTAGSDAKTEHYNKYTHRYKIMWNKYDADSSIDAAPTNSFWNDEELADTISKQPMPELGAIIDYSYSNSLISNTSKVTDEMDPDNPDDDFEYTEFTPTGGQQNGYAGYLANAAYTFEHLLEKSFRDGNIYQDGEDIAFENAIYFYKNYLGYEVPDNPYTLLSIHTSDAKDDVKHTWFRNHVLKSRYWYNIITTQKWEEAYKKEIGDWDAAAAAGLAGGSGALDGDEFAGDDGLNVKKAGKYWMELKSYLPSETVNNGGFDLSHGEASDFSKLGVGGLTDYRQKSHAPRKVDENVRDIMRDPDVMEYFNLEEYNKWTGEDSRLAYNLKGNKFDNSTIASTAISMSYPYSYHNYACDDDTTVGKGFVYRDSIKRFDSLGMVGSLKSTDNNVDATDKPLIGRRCTRQYVAIKTMIDFYEKQMRFTEDMKKYGFDYAYDVTKALSTKSVADSSGYASELYQNNNFNDAFGALSTVIRASGRDDAFPSTPYLLYMYLGIAEMDESNIVGSTCFFNKDRYDDVADRMRRDTIKDKTPTTIESRTWSLWDIMHEKLVKGDMSDDIAEEMKEALNDAAAAGAGVSETDDEKAPGRARWHLVGQLTTQSSSVDSHLINYKNLKPGDICIGDKFCFVYVGTEANSKFMDYSEFENAKYAICYAEIDYETIWDIVVKSHPGLDERSLGGYYNTNKSKLMPSNGVNSTGLTCRSIGDDGKTPYIEQLLNEYDSDRCVYVYRSDNSDYEQSPYYKMLSNFDYRDYQDGGHESSVEYSAGTVTSFFNEFPGMEEVKLSIVDAHAAALEKALGKAKADLYRKWAYTQIYGNLSSSGDAEAETPSS